MVHEQWFGLLLWFGVGERWWDGEVGRDVAGMVGVLGVFTSQGAVRFNDPDEHVVDPVDELDVVGGAFNHEVELC